MFPRYLVSAILGGVVTFGLFFVMQGLIAMGDARLDDRNKGSVIEFVRLKKEQELATKDREVPDKKPPEEPP